MATQVADAPGLGTIEERSIDWVPEDARHGKLWHQAPLWFLGNFQYFSIPIGFIGPAMGLALGWTILAGGLGGTLETGRTLNYLDQGEDDRKMCSLYLSLMDRFGIKLEQFGDSQARLQRL